MHGNIRVLDGDQSARHDKRVWAFSEDCREGGADFGEYLKPWHMADALEAINDAARNHPPERALTLIKQALEEVFAIAADEYRAALEWEGVDSG